eukprot:GFUD01003416.1.p1 GENE.GFUD01003416.1~~GFUD01003416.1.p1  ORF type:complete len:1055 (+),score=218.84 GFUD01003416.1:46-3210(+)
MSLSWKFRRLLASALTDLVLWGSWLLVVTASLVLPIYLGISFLSARNCQPHKDLSFPPGFLSGIELNPVNVNQEEKSLIEMVFPADITLVLGGENVSVPVLPLHLFRSGSLILQEVLEKYSPGDVAVHCKVNGIKRNGVVSLGVSVCNSTLSDLLGEEQVSGLKAWLSGLGEGVEGDLVNSFMSGNLTNTIQLLPEIFVDAGLTEEHVSALSSLVAPFTTSELTNLLAAARKANLTDKDMAVLEEVSKTSVEDLKDVEKVLMKINVTNLPAIVEKLDLLEIQLTDLITNPGIFFEFLGDPVKSAILVDLQTLLPRFKPSDIETFLKLQQNLDDAQLKYGDPDAPPLMSKLFSIPMDVLLSAMPKLKLDDSAKAAFDTFKLLMEDEDFELLSALASTLLETEAQEKLIQGCTSQQLDISCRDQINDVCPMGHIFLGLASLAPLLIPGLLYSLTTFLHYQGDIMQCGVGKPFNIPSSKLDRLSAWLILLPLYLLFMIPWTLVLIVYRQLVVCHSLVKESSGGPRVEADCEGINNASSFGLLSGAGQGVLHLGLQMVVVVLLVGAGDVLLGLEQEYVATMVSVSIASVILSSLVLGVSYLSGQECGRLSQDLSTPASSFNYIFTSLCWLITATLISAISTVLLSVLLYVDSVAFSTGSWIVVPILLLVILPLLQCMTYQHVVREGCEQRFGWGIMAAVIPVRFLDIDKKRARSFLLISQGMWLFFHVASWLAYSIYVLGTDSSDVVFRVWLPIVIPALLLPPLVAGLHWSISLAPLYSSKHAHPDMVDIDKRTFSFPPDWRNLSGTAVRPDSLAEAGFFYSCRRLSSGEATCYSCGRQVTDWSNGKTAAQAHRMATDHCPLYTDDKEISESFENLQKNSVSCFAEFFFIAATLLFRLASVCLLLWVFMEQWQQVSPFLPTLIIIPPLYLLILILLNFCTYYICLGAKGTSTIWAILSILLPRPVKASLSSARQLLVINVACNSLVHAFLWAAMIGACSECSLRLSLSSLSAAWPALLVLGILAILSAIPYYYFTIKPSRPATPPIKKGTTYVVSTAL